MLSIEEIKLLPEYNNHEKVEYFSDTESGLRGYIAIHNTNLGPAVGGTRMQAYPSEESAVRDVLKLSHSMTYKCALAGVPYGGGKVVIIGSPKAKTEKFLRAYGRIIEKYGGLIRTGVDVGIEDNDVSVMAEETKYMIGVLSLQHPEKLNTSEMAARSVFVSLKACFKKLFGTGSPAGRTVAVKGLGKVGGELTRLLYDEGAKLVVADINQEHVDKILRQCPKAEVVFHEVIHKTVCDSFAPCALGEEFNDQTVRQLNAKIVCGGANDQLESARIGDLIHDLGILYAPDYVVNAGGLINVVDELEPDGYKRDRVLARIDKIPALLEEIFKKSETEKKSPSAIASELAEKIFKAPKSADKNARTFSAL